MPEVSKMTTYCVSVAHPMQNDGCTRTMIIRICSVCNMIRWHTSVQDSKRKMQMVSQAREHDILDKRSEESACIRLQTTL